MQAQSALMQKLIKQEDADCAEEETVPASTLPDATGDELEAPRGDVYFHADDVHASPGHDDKIPAETLPALSLVQVHIPPPDSAVVLWSQDPAQAGAEVEGPGAAVPTGSLPETRPVEEADEPLLVAGAEQEASLPDFVAEAESLGQLDEPSAVAGIPAPKQEALHPGVPSAALPAHPATSQATVEKDDEPSDYTTVPPPALSDSAIYNRLYRVIKKKDKDGNPVLSQQWISQWNDLSEGGGRDQMKSTFEKLAYKPDWGLEMSCSLCSPFFFLIVCLLSCACVFFLPLLAGEVHQKVQGHHRENFGGNIRDRRGVAYYG